MSSPPWMPFNVGDYLADTGHLTVSEHGAYMLLIMRYWQDGGLPADEKLVARYAHMNAEQWAESRDVLAALFDEGWSHKRINAELAKAAEIIGKRSNAAKARHAKTPASAVHVDSTSSYTGVPHQHTQEVDAAQSRKRSRAELDRLEADLREAAGFQTNPSPGLFVLAPILGLLDIGYDIEADILPTVRAVASRMKRPARSWDYFVEPIREAIADRQAVAARGRAPPGKHQPTGTGRTNVFERLKGQADERGGEDGGSGPVVDAIRSIPDLRRQDERDDGQGVPAGDRWVFPARAS